MVILGLYTVLSPFLVIYGIKLGFKMATEPEEAASEPVFRTPKRRKSPKLPEDVKRDLDILHNIDVFDGTSKGQKEIKGESR